MHCNIQLSLLFFTLQCEKFFNLQNQFIVLMSTPQESSRGAIQTVLQSRWTRIYSMLFLIDCLLFILMFNFSFSCSFFHFCIALHDFDLNLWFIDSCIQSDHLAIIFRSFFLQNVLQTSHMNNGLHNFCLCGWSLGPKSDIEILRSHNGSRCCFPLLLQ